MPTKERQAKESAESYEPRAKKMTLEMNMTLEEIADIMGLTRERVRQIEKKALAKMRIRLMERGLELSDIIGTMEELPQRKAGGIRPDD